MGGSRGLRMLATSVTGVSCVNISQRGREAVERLVGLVLSGGDGYYTML